MTTARLAGFITRATALVIDAAILNGAALAVGAGVALVSNVIGLNLPSGAVEVVLGAGLGWIVLVSCYFAGFWRLTGQTPGARFMGLRVIDRTGGPLTGPQALLRVFGMVLAALPFGLGYALILVDDRRRGLQDFVASTLVIHDPRSGAEAPAADDRVRVDLVESDRAGTLGGHAQRAGGLGAKTLGD